MFLIVAITILLPAIIGIVGSLIVPALVLYLMAGAAGAAGGLMLLSVLNDKGSGGSGAIGVMVFGIMLVGFGLILALSTLISTCIF